MDPLRLHAYKIHAIRKHKRQQFVGTVLLYSFSALACSLLCCSALWYPPFCATFNVIFFLFLPKLSSFFFSSKVLFVVGNLIVIFLVGESKFFASKPKAASHANYRSSDIICYDNKYKYCKPETDRVFTPTIMGNKKGKGLTRCIFESSDGDQEKRAEMAKSNEDRTFKQHRREEVINVEDLDKGDEEELNKLADDFIARVNRQRRLEAEFCRL